MSVKSSSFSTIFVGWIFQGPPEKQGSSFRLGPDGVCLFHSWYPPWYFGGPGAGIGASYLLMLTGWSEWWTHRLPPPGKLQAGYWKLLTYPQMEKPPTQYECHQFCHSETSWPTNITTYWGEECSLRVSNVGRSSNACALFLLRWSHLSPDLVNPS